MHACMGHESRNDQVRTRCPWAGPRLWTRTATCATSSALCRRHVTSQRLYDHISHNSGTKTYNDPRLVIDENSDEEEIVETATRIEEKQKPSANAWKVWEDFQADTDY